MLGQVSLAGHSGYIVTLYDVLLKEIKFMHLCLLNFDIICRVLVLLNIWSNQWISRYFAYYMMDRSGWQARHHCFLARHHCWTFQNCILYRINEEKDRVVGRASENNSLQCTRCRLLKPNLLFSNHSCQSKFQTCLFTVFIRNEQRLPGCNMGCPLVLWWWAT